MTNSLEKTKGRKYQDFHRKFKHILDHSFYGRVLREFFDNLRANRAQGSAAMM